MKAKGLVKFFLYALVVACLYQLSYTFMASMVESNAREYANGDAAKEERYLDSVADKSIFDVGFWKVSYKEAREKQLNLGLDLKGGMNVVMEVSVSDVIRAMSGYSTDSTFNQAMAMAVKAQESSQADFVTLFVQSFRKVDPNAKLASVFATRENAGKIEFNTSDADVEKVLRQESERAIDRSFEILRTRIDKFGVTQPNIQRQQGTGRIIIELPGVKDPRRVRKLLQGTASLEFWETYDAGEVLARIGDVNKYLGQRNELEKKTGKISSTDTTAVAASDSGQDSAKAGSSLMSKIGKGGAKTRKDSASLSQEEAIRQNPLFAKLQPNVDPQKGTVPDGPVIGYAMAIDTADINAMFARDDVRMMLPKNLRLLWTAKGVGDGERFFQLIAIKKKGNSDRAPLEGDVITNARENIDNFGQIEVTMTMNPEGAKVWRRLTADNIGKSVAIVLDNYVYSFPNVNSEISGGVSSISGNFTVDEAKDLANILEAGKLPAPAKIVEEAVVGPTLGKEAINSGLIASIAGLLVVILYMAMYYSTAGNIASIAILANLFFTFGVLASLQAVLTLPGIAGIVLSMGMSVDANVLIYERIKEELENGKSLRMAIIEGFTHAYSAIIDSNLTTLLTAIILFTFGTGPIQGFATTLIIGIFSSMFSAIFITRLIIDARVAKEKPINFDTPLSRNLFKVEKIQFIKNRKIFYISSSVIILAGIGSMFVNGFNLGVDFKGGRSYVVQLDKEISSSEVRELLGETMGSRPEVKTFGGDNKFRITTSYLINDKSEEADLKAETKLFEGLKSLIPANMTYEDFASKVVLSSQKVGPTIVDDIKISAVYSIIFGIVGICIYILIRFRKLEYSIGAAAALIHDVLVMLAFVSLLWKIMPFSLEIDQHLIAAILTIIGYSINDTVVVYDRLREYFSLHHGAKDDAEVINDALNATLSRTINTALATMLTVIILLFFGGEVIRGFSFSLLIGLLVGTYSSIFVAASVVLDFGNWRNRNKKA